MTDPQASQNPAAQPDEGVDARRWSLKTILFYVVAGLIVFGASIGFALLGGPADRPLGTLPPPTATPAPTGDATSTVRLIWPQI
jgi:hypothetical protein